MNARITGNKARYIDSYYNLEITVEDYIKGVSISCTVILPDLLNKDYQVYLGSKPLKVLSVLELPVYK